LNKSQNALTLKVPFIFIDWISAIPTQSASWCQQFTFCSRWLVAGLFEVAVQPKPRRPDRSSDLPVFQNQALWKPIEDAAEQTSVRRILAQKKA
jgi:hypothetical protein